MPGSVILTVTCLMAAEANHNEEGQDRERGNSSSCGRERARSKDVPWARLKTVTGYKRRTRRAPRNQGVWRV